jgi:hypothetical protein
VDPWQGETDSTNLLAAIAGDDPLPDIMISRIPVNSEAELELIIDKIGYYEGKKFEPWLDNFLFISDNKDAAGDFGYYADEIIKDYIVSGYKPYRLYQDIITDTNELNTDIINTINITGTLIANYIGHGSISYWATRIFSADDISLLDNGDYLPIILSMTCWDGYFIYPGKDGLIEQMLRADSKGAVAAFSPTGLGVSTGHDHLHRGFYDALIYQGESTLGPLTQAAKLRLYQTGANYDLLHTFTIFGDPALQIPITRRVYLPAIEK